jgi:hypothetical protein
MTTDALSSSIRRTAARSSVAGGNTAELP